MILKIKDDPPFFERKKNIQTRVSFVTREWKDVRKLGLKIISLEEKEKRVYVW